MRAACADCASAGAAKDAVIAPRRPVNKTGRCDFMSPLTHGERASFLLQSSASGDPGGCAAARGEWMPYEGLLALLDGTRRGRTRLGDGGRLLLILVHCVLFLRSVFGLRRFVAHGSPSRFAVDDDRLQSDSRASVPHPETKSR